jgi:hypothetical protein
MSAIRIYKQGSNIIMADNATGLIMYSLPPENWRVETKQLGNTYVLRFFNELTQSYARNGESFSVADIKDENGLAYVTPSVPSAVTIDEIHLLHRKINLFINTEGYLNLANNYHYISTAGNNEILIKAAPTFVVGWNLSNTTGQYRYVKIHDTATAPIQGTTTVKTTIAIPPNDTEIFFIENGLYCATGLAITASTRPENNATNDVNANDIVGEIFFT